MARYAARSVIKRMLNNGVDVARSTVGVMGITFKENCPDIRNSKVVDLVTELRKWSVEVVVEDPWAEPEEVWREYGLRTGRIGDPQGVDALVVAVGHRQFRETPIAELRARCRAGRPVFADLKSLYDRHEAEAAGFDVFRL
jgi:UDP-N-acetyl-D-galactosamine dehydrogenase